MATVPAATSKRETALAALAIAVLAACFLQPSIRGFDGPGNYVYLMSMLNDGDLDFRNDYAAFDLSRDTPFKLSDAPVHPSTGLPANRYGIGAAIFWAPAVVLVHGLLLLAAPELATGLTAPYEWAVGVATAWWSGVGLWVLYVFLRRRFAIAVSAAALAGILFATPLFFYTFMHGSMSHGVSFFLTVMVLVGLERLADRPTLLRAAFVGVWTGLMIVTRLQDATWGPAIALGVFLATLQRPVGGVTVLGEVAGEGSGQAMSGHGGGSFLAGDRQSSAATSSAPTKTTAPGTAPAVQSSPGDPPPDSLSEPSCARMKFAEPPKDEIDSHPLPAGESRPADDAPMRLWLWRAALLLVFGLTAALAFLPQMAVWNVLYGDWFSGPLPYLGREGGMLETWPMHFLEALFTQRGGAFAWHPILIVCIAGLIAGRRRLGWMIFAVGLLGFALQLYLVSSWSMWWGGASFGNRFFISSYPWLAAGLAWVFAWLASRRLFWIGLAALLLLIAWNFGLLLQYGLEMIPREKDVGWSVVIRNQFTRVPEWILNRLGL